MATLTPIQVSPTVHLTAAGAITATLPNPTGQGNTLVACINANGTTANPVATSATLGGLADHWAQAVANNPGVQSDAQIWYDPGAAAGQTSIVVTFGTAGSGTIDEYLTVYEVPGVLSADKTITANSGAATTFTSGATAAAAFNDEIFFGALVSSSSTLPVATGAGTWTTQGSTGTRFALHGYQVTAAGGTATYSGTQSSGTYSVAVATFFATGGGGSMGQPLGPGWHPGTGLPGLPGGTPFWSPPGVGGAAPVAAAAVTGPPVYPLGHPVQAKALPARGGTVTRRGGTFGQLGPPVKAPSGPVQARIPQPPRGGQVTRRAGPFGGVGPAVKALASAVASRLRGFPPRGRTASRAGTYGQLGPQVKPAAGPVQARQLPRRGGTAQGRTGTFTSTVPQAGPPVYPLGRPVQARRQPLTGGRVVKAAGAYAGTGPAAVPLRRPARGQPQKPLLTGRVAHRAGPAVPPPALQNATSSPAVGDPDTSAALVTDPRDGTRSVTATGTSTAGVTDPRDGTRSVTDPATSVPGVSDG